MHDVDVQFGKKVKLENIVFFQFFVQFEGKNFDASSFPCVLLHIFHHFASIFLVKIGICSFCVSKVMKRKIYLSVI